MSPLAKSNILSWGVWHFNSILDTQWKDRKVAVLSSATEKFELCPNLAMPFSILLFIFSPEIGTHWRLHFAKMLQVRKTLEANWCTGEKWSCVFPWSMMEQVDLIWRSSHINEPDFSLEEVLWSPHNDWKTDTDVYCFGWNRGEGVWQRCSDTGSVDMVTFLTSILVGFPVWFDISFNQKEYVGAFCIVIHCITTEISGNQWLFVIHIILQKILDLLQKNFSSTTNVLGTSSMQYMGLRRVWDG